MIAIIDYSMGNLHSVKNALDYIGADSVITDSADVIRSADAMLLPGVGAFPDAMKALRERGLDTLIRNEALNDKPLLGICLGMQLLFDSSTEFQYCEGLSLIPGNVTLMNSNGLKLPHIGWNSLEYNLSDPLLNGGRNGDYVYFVHSYRANTDSCNVVAYSTYSERFPALVRHPSLNIYGAQFHPEKSHDTGLNMLKAFNKIVTETKL